MKRKRRNTYLVSALTLALVFALVILIFRDALPGIGPATAQAIIEDREANGPFATVEDLMRVSGIGEKKFAKLEGSICV